jgi:uncharacterized protein (DUF1697 family)
MAASKASGVHVALLRGINVTGKNKLPMAELRQMFEDVGCRDVETYIQSGNVVFAASETRARKVPMAVRQAIADAFGYHVPVVLRSAVELRQAFRGNPFLGEEVDIKALHVAFLDDQPKAAQARALDADRSPPDRFVVRRREIYLCCPKGLARSKLTNAYFDSKLGTTSTLRNWKTVTRLVEMVDHWPG